MYREEACSGSATFPVISCGSVCSSVKRLASVGRVFRHLLDLFIDRRSDWLSVASVGPIVSGLHVLVPICSLGFPNMYSVHYSAFHWLKSIQASLLFLIIHLLLIGCKSIYGCERSLVMIRLCCDWIFKLTCLAFKDHPPLSLNLALA